MAATRSDVALVSFFSDVEKEFNARSETVARNFKFSIIQKRIPDIPLFLSPIQIHVYFMN